MAYILPTPTDWVTCSWSCHRNRNPPSQQPGTDYGSAYGSPLYAVADGIITYVKHSNSGGDGRMVRLKTWAGQETQSLHNSELWVSVGQHVLQGQIIGLTGASAYGDDWYHGPHNHQTLWEGLAWSSSIIDFEEHVGPPVPPPPGPQDDSIQVIIASVGMRAS